MKRFESHPCTANKLDELLNDQAAEGWEPYEFIVVGMQEQRNPLMPNKATMMPMLIVVFFKEIAIHA